MSSSDTANEEISKSKEGYIYVLWNKAFGENMLRSDVQKI